MQLARRGRRIAPWKKSMKTMNLAKLLWRAVDESERLPLSEAEQRLYTSLHLALMAYEDEVRLGHPAPERRCMICNVPVSECSC
jgi:hypothetical protein